MQTKTMYKINMVLRGRTSIKPIQVIKETEHFVTVESGNRIAKDSETAKVFASLEDAKTFARKRIARVITDSNHVIENAVHDLRKLEV